MMTNYVGCLLTSEMARKFANSLHSKNVIRLPKSMPQITNEAKSLKPYEDIIFSMFHRRTIIFYDIRYRIYLEMLIQNGWLRDMRLMTSDSFNVFQNEIDHYLLSRHWRYHLCNEIRDKVYDRMIEPFRICGPELETLLKPKHFIRASSFVGLNDYGWYMNYDGSGNYVILRENNIYDISGDYERIKALFSDSPGQAKLWSLYAGFVTNFPLLYAGSSPGQGWLQARAGPSFAIPWGWQLSSPRICLCLLASQCIK